jgi:hypothetical protein
LTFETTGSKQVSVIGQEEKRAFTVVNGILARGHALPLQLIYEGKTSRSLPSKSTPQYKEAMELKFKISYSSMHTYWSTFPLMCEYVNNILVPYWEEQKVLLDALADQECVLHLDVWSVHRSIQFHTWLDMTYPWIKYRFVPGGCTGVGQPCDVGIQRPFKLVVKQTQHADIVNESLARLTHDSSASLIRLDTTIGTLHDQSLQWVVNGYHAINKPELVKQVFFSFTCIVES